MINSEEQFIATALSPTEDARLQLLDLGTKARRDLVEGDVEITRFVIPTEYFDLDSLTGGLRRQELMMVGGESGVGKTTFALNLALRVAQWGVSVGFFSQEMSKAWVSERAQSICSGIGSRHLRYQWLGSRELNHLDEVANAPFWQKLTVNDSPHLPLTTILKEIWNIRQVKGLDVLIVDRPEWIKLPRGLGNTTVTSHLRRAAKLLDFALVGISTQIPHPNHNRVTRFFQDADQVLYLEREDLHYPDSDKRGIIDVNLSKNRSGPTGQLTLLYLEQTGQIVDLEIAAETRGCPNGKS